MSTIPATIEEFYEQSQGLIDAVNAFDSRYSASAFAEIDHLCYRCGSHESYLALKELLWPVTVYRYESPIGRRAISLIRLKRTVPSQFGPIHFLELSDQKPDHSQVDGFDHVEIYPKVGSVSSLEHRFANLGTRFEKTVRPHHTTYDLKLPGSFSLKLCDEPLIEKIKENEFV